MNFRCIIFLAIIFAIFRAQASVEEEVPIILREPAGLKTGVWLPEAKATVNFIVNNNTLKATTTFYDWSIGEIVVVESKSTESKIIAFIEISEIKNNQDGTYELTCKLIRQSRTNMIQVGDELMHLDLSGENKHYIGTTDLLVKQSDKNISSKYKPLFLQGFTVGETAQTLWKNEYLINQFGQVSYGVQDWLTVNTVVPANFVGAPNAAVKARFYSSYSNIFAAGLNYAKIPSQTNSTLNLNIYWDSVSSETVIGHSLLSIALFSFEKAEDATAIKSLGTSSIQTGSELILSNWDRVLWGPSYNFELKAVGGYLTYMKIWDKFHLSFSLNSTNITSFKLSPVDGYYFIFDAYWRF